MLQESGYLLQGRPPFFQDISSNLFFWWCLKAAVIRPASWNLWFIMNQKYLTMKDVVFRADLLCTLGLYRAFVCTMGLTGLTGQLQCVISSPPTGCNYVKHFAIVITMWPRCQPTWRGWEITLWLVYCMLPPRINAKVKYNCCLLNWLLLNKQK